MTNQLIQKKQKAVLMLTLLLVVFVTVSGFMWNHGFQTTKIETRTVEVPVVVQYERVDTLPKGEEKVLQEGTVGLDEVEEEIHYKQGDVIDTKELQRKTITPMQPKVVQVGTREVEVSRSYDRVREVITMEATAYLPTDGGGDGITATGIRARHGVVAVDPNVIPLGTRVYIPGYGEAIAADTGGDIIGNRIDVVLEDYGSAMQFGRRTVDVYILSS
ncbi:G5 and 3D domain-containing protein [Veillonella sp. 3627]|uniref:G5 and 3D domain-containing protein n=1 Tax=Veillonella sp. 3627 TaxID=2490953 RepID=UPI000F8C48F4|nr:3D domain-containing protein [Veillonella sp. 3627]